MRIRGGQSRWVLHPGSSILLPLLPAENQPQPQVQPSFPPIIKSSISSEKDASLNGTEKDEYTTVVATIPRKYDYNPSAEVAVDTDSSNSSSSYHDWRWLEEDKALPLKKRRMVQLDLKAKQPLKNSIETRPKRKRTKKIWIDYILQENRCVQKASTKTRNINERCNRQNGKGWRCSLSAVDGHHLCGHHLDEQKKKPRKK